MKELKPAFIGIIVAIIAFAILYFIFLTPQTEDVKISDQKPIQIPITTSPTPTPAEDFSGSWASFISFTEKPTNCEYNGNVVLTLQQDKNDVQGKFDLIVINAKLVTGADFCVKVGTRFSYDVEGTVKESKINLTVEDTDRLFGSIDRDKLALKWEKCDSCELDQSITPTGSILLSKI